MAEETGGTPAAETPGFKHMEDFYSAYANNIQLEPSALDLKLLFGELDIRGGKVVAVEQHTAVTITWVQAKLLSYLLSLNIASHEIENGKIKMPATMIPAVPFLPKGWENNSNAKAAVEAWTKIYTEFMASLPT